jgi:uncharacterized cysteine cluster protein YcgN (CxxCxxCC family)
MIQEKTIQVEKQEVVDVICDCCGKSCMREGMGGGLEYMTMSAHWGFWSNKDLEKWTAQICEACVDEKFGFVKFQKTGYNPLRG